MRKALIVKIKLLEIYIFINISKYNIPCIGVLGK